MSITTILIIILVLILLGVFPMGSRFGWQPMYSGGIGLVLVIVLLVLLLR